MKSFSPIIPLLAFSNRIAKDLRERKKLFERIERKVDSQKREYDDSERSSRDYSDRPAPVEADWKRAASVSTRQPRFHDTDSNRENRRY